MKCKEEKNKAIMSEMVHVKGNRDDKMHALSASQRSNTLKLPYFPLFQVW